MVCKGIRITLQALVLEVCLICGVVCDVVLRPCWMDTKKGRRKHASRKYHKRMSDQEEAKLVGIKTCRDERKMGVDRVRVREEFVAPWIY